MAVPERSAHHVPDIASSVEADTLPMSAGSLLLRRAGRVDRKAHNAFLSSLQKTPISNAKRRLTQRDFRIRKAKR
jgi:hypothetical protein